MSDRLIRTNSSSGLAKSENSQKELRNLNQELERTAQHRMLALQAACLGWWYYDPVTRIVSWDDRCKAILGLEHNSGSMDEILARVHPEDLPGVQAKLAALLNPMNQGSYFSEHRITVADGSVRWIEAYAIASLEGAGDQRKVTSLIGTAADITERKRIEAALSESEDKFRSAFVNAAIGFAMTDPNGHFLDANAAYCSLTGYSIDELRSMQFQTLIHPDDFEQNMEQIERMLSGQTTDFTIENRYLCKDGTSVWVRKNVSLVRSSEGRPKWIIALIEDISKLCQAKEDFARAQEVGQIGWWRLDTQRNVLTWSDESYRIFGVPMGTPMTYEDFLKTIHPDDCEYVNLRWNAGLRGEPYDIEHRIVIGGQIKWVREKAYLEFDESGNLLGGFGITQDITDRKEAEQQFHKLNETLEQRVADRTAEMQRQADKLRALARQLSQAELRERKRLAYILHDHIQQLIVAARMQIDWLKRDDNLPRMQSTAQGIDGILREALEASRSLTVDLSPPALHEGGLIGGLSWLAARYWEKYRFTVNLRTDSKAEPASEELCFLLFECARELLFNAMKHAKVSEAQVTLGMTDNSCVQLIVSDQGKGFDLDLIRDRQSGEMTFGLFSIQERLMHIGGGMNVESAPEKGSKMTLWAPIDTVAAPSDRTYKQAPKVESMIDEGRIQDQRQPCRIFIVDDHKIMREGLTRLLQLESGIEVVGEAADGPQAIELARKLKPDIIIMDVNLGDMTGVEATRRILADNPAIKIIGLSMHQDPHFAVAMQEAGAMAYLTKGGPSEDLIAAIHACAKSRFPAD